MQHLNRFFWWCAGVEPSILEKYPTEWGKYFGIGGTIMFTALMAGFAGGYAFFTAFKSIALSIFFGLFWGALIFNLDRYIVSTIGKGDGTQRITITEWKNATPRLILAILIGFVIATPLELKVFEKEIGVEIKKIINEKRQQMTYGLNDIRDEQQRIKDRIAELNAEQEKQSSDINQGAHPGVQVKEGEVKILSLEENKANSSLQNIRSKIQQTYANLNAVNNRLSESPNDQGLYNLKKKFESQLKNFQQQESALEGQIKSISAKIGKANNDISNIKNELIDSYDSKRKQNENAIEKLNNQILYLDSIYHSKAKEYTDVSTQYDGFMAQLEALDRLSVRIDTNYTYQNSGLNEPSTSNFNNTTELRPSDQTIKKNLEISKHYTVVFYAKWLITFLLIGIEIAPVLFKMMTEAGPYDDRIDEIKYESEVEKKKFISNINQNINTDLHISNEINAKKIEEELRTNQTLLKAVSDAQSEIVIKAIETWKKEQIKKAEENPENFIKLVQKTS